jgi:hypothetical protein
MSFCPLHRPAQALVFQTGVRDRRAATASAAAHVVASAGLRSSLRTTPNLRRAPWPSTRHRGLIDVDQSLLATSLFLKSAILDSSPALLGVPLEREGQDSAPAISMRQSFPPAFSGDR